MGAVGRIHAGGEGQTKLCGKKQTSNREIKKPGRDDPGNATREPALPQNW